MSEEDSPQTSVCENFEPQAWRKTVCRNCFQPPESHVAGSGENGVDVSSGNVKSKPDAMSTADKKSAASSIKNKFEQLEKDKYKPKEASNTLPRTKKAGGLSLITEKYTQLDREAGKVESPTKSIPPPTPPKTYKKDGSMKSKFGSMENVSADIIDGSDNKLGMKLKFGSMENISLGQEKRKDTVPILTHKSKLGSSVEKTSGGDKIIDGRQAMLSKLDSFQMEVQSGAMSKAGQTVIHKQKDGHVDIITLPKKSSIEIKTNDSKIQSKDSAVKLNEKIDSKSKFEKPELKSTSTKDTGLSKVGQKSKIDIKTTSSESEKENGLKGAKDVLSSNRLKSTKTDDSKDKPADKDAKSGWKKPELKSSNTEKEETKPTSLKDRLSKPSDRSKPDEPKKTSLSLKDQLKSPSVDKDPLSKLKDKLKSPTTETDNKQAPSWKDRLKASSTDADKTSDTQSKALTATAVAGDKLKSPSTNDKKQVTDVDKKPDLSSKKENESADKKLGDKGKLTAGVKLKMDSDSKSQDKNTSNDLKSKFNKPGLKTGKDEDISSKSKTFDLRNSLKKANDTPSAVKDPAKVDTKKKFELPSLKSSKNTPLNDKSKDTDVKANSKDTKASDKTGNKFEPKFKLNKTNEPKSSVIEEKTGAKAKFELPKLKSKSDAQDDPKSSLKSKLEPKSKLMETKTDSKNKFEIPNLKKTKSPDHEQKLEKDTSAETKDSKDSSTDKEISNLKKDKSPEHEQKIKKDKSAETKDPKDSSTDEENLTYIKLPSTDAEKSTDEVEAPTSVDSAYVFQLNNEMNKNENHNAETTEELSLDKNTPVTSVISVTTSFENISSDSEVVSGDACAETSTRDTKSPLHVDTQVFTSSRSKTAGVSSLDDSNFDDNKQGFSGLSLTKSNKTKSPPKDTLVNGDIVLEHFNGSNKKETNDNEKAVGSKYSDDELERLKAELLNMTERCQNLETENEMLRSDLNKKALTESTAKKQRDDVESAINGLRGQLQSMEDKCSQLESENINMMNDLKAKHEINHSKPHTKETDEIDEKLTAKEKLMEDLMEENDQLKQDINELKVEMEEMYDSFRDQEAEEFREIQKELEYTAKNCRILQFKLRKMERRNDQTEQDKNQFEERLRKLQNSFQDRDAVSHIHSLEDELRLAKEVSVRLHDELDLMEDRRGKVEEENRHLTELLEQADRKQFRLELEVDKLRDKVVELRQELRLREAGNENEPRKLNCAEFLALHRETI